jgi:hypothetical protein
MQLMNQTYAMTSVKRGAGGIPDIQVDAHPEDQAFQR